MIRKTRHKKVIQKFLKGAKIEYRDPAKVPFSKKWERTETPNFLESWDYRVIETEPKIIDMSKFNVDNAPCLVGNGKRQTLRLFDYKLPDLYSYCRVVEKFWYVNNGYSECPIPDGFEFEVKLANGNTGNTGDTGNYNWESDSYLSIVAFRITGLKKGWQYPTP